MNSTVGTVVSLRGEGSHRTASVEVSAETVCARCAAGKGCGAGLFGKRETLRRVEAPVPRDMALREGDTVRLAMHSSDLLAAATVVYGWPLASGVMGALLAWQLGASDAVAAASALAGIGAGAWFARRRVRESACLERFTPRILS